MPKILRIINRFNLGGISYNVSYLSRFLPEKYETLLIGGPEEHSEESSLFIPESMGLKPVLITEMKRSLNPFSDLLAYWKIKKIIKEFKPDIVHTHASKAGAIGRLAAIHCQVPVVVHTFHGHVFSGYFGSAVTNIFKNIERFLAKKTTAIIAISQKQKSELNLTYRICSAEKTEVIPLGFDLKKFTEDQEVKRKNFRLRFNIKEDELLIGIIGRLAPIKNHKLFVDAVVELNKKTKRTFKAIIIGDGETRPSLEAYIASLGSHTPSLFLFAGWIKEVDVALAGLDLVCLSSKNEGTPVSLIEAQAAGRFIISTDVGGIVDILHPKCGLLSEVGDDAAFINNLCEAVNHFEKYNSGANAAREDILIKFSYKRLCSDMDHLYSKLLKQAGISLG